jgi:glyoxylase I family protein
MESLAAGARFNHTNLIAHDWKKLADFYGRVFGCVPLLPERNQSGEWLERGTNVRDAKLAGVHLRLPGHGENGPTLEIYTYSAIVPRGESAANWAGYGHIAFAVDDVDQALKAILSAGGTRLGEIVSAEVQGAGRITFTYARDPEGNIIELQHWHP